MASTNQTPCFGLSQWEPQDAFTRTDFNENFVKIDRELSENRTRSDRALNGLVPMAWNVYNLYLKDYYEGHYTGFKRAMAFDGFLDEGQIESRSEGLHYSKAGHFLFLEGLTSENQDVNFGQQFTTALSAGQSLAFKWACNRVGFAGAFRVLMSGSATLAITSATGDLQKSWDKASYGTAIEEVSFPIGFDLDPGETYTFKLTAKTQVIVGRNTWGATDPAFGIRVILTPEPCSSGTVISKKYYTDTDYSQARAWVRYWLGPAPEVSVWDKVSNSWNPMTFIESRSAVNQLGEECSEAAYFLPELAAYNRSIKVMITLNRFSGHSLKLFDYGIVAL